MAYDFWGSNFGGKQDKNTGKIVTSAPATSKPATTTSSSSSSKSSSSSSKSSSSSSKSSTPSYLEHVSWFGSPEKYASAIKDALNSGKQLSDPSAAAAFQKDNPQYFGGIVPGSGSTPAPSYSSGATGGGATKTGGIGNNSAALIDALKNIGSQFGSASPSGQTALNTQANDARNAFIQAGGNIQDIPTNLWGSSPDKGFQTGGESFIGSPSYGAGLTSGGMPAANAGLTPGPAPSNTAEAIMAGMVVPQNADFFNSIPEDAQQYFRAAGGKNEDLSNIFASNFKDGQFDYEGVRQGVTNYIEQSPLMQQQQQMQQPEYLMQQIPSIIESVFSQYPVSQETAGIFDAGLDKILGEIDAFQSNYMERLNQMGSGLDPATMTALASLKETVAQQRELLKEEMASRGLLQSGIYLRDLDERINKNELSQTQQLLSQQLSDIQSQINNALLSFGNARINATSQYGLAATQAAEAAAARQEQARTSLQNALIEALQKQQSDAANLSWEKEKFYAPWTMGATPSEMLPYQFPSANTVYSNTNPSADTLLKQSQWETEWPYKQAQYEYDLNKPYYKPSTGSSGTSEYKQEQDSMKTTQWIENEATARAKGDSRLANEDNPADGKNYFTLPQLIDAWRRDLTMQVYGY